MRCLFILLLLTSSFVFSSEKETKECADIEDPTLRLSCYDSLFRTPPIEDSELVVPQKKKEATVSKNEKEIKQAKERRFGLPQRKETEKEIKEDKERRFGLPKRKETEEEKIEITDKIVKVTQLTSLRLDITLGNDQKWRSIEKIRQIRLKPGQEVVISEGFISGYVLKVVGKKISIRVKRIK